MNSSCNICSASQHREKTSLSFGLTAWDAGSFLLFSNEMVLLISTFRAFCRNDQRLTCGARQDIFIFVFCRSLCVLADLSSFSSVMLCAYFLFLKFELLFWKWFQAWSWYLKISKTHLVTSDHMLGTKFLWGYLARIESQANCSFLQMRKNNLSLQTN